MLTRVEGVGATAGAAFGRAVLAQGCQPVAGVAVDVGRAVVRQPGHERLVSAAIAEEYLRLRDVPLLEPRNFRQLFFLLRKK